jgi:integrase
MVFKRGNKWYATYREIPDGARRQRAVSTDKSVAKQIENELRNNFLKFEQGLYHPAVEHLNVNLTQHLKEFLECLRGGGISKRRGKPSEDYCSYVEAHLRTALKHMRAYRPADLTTEKLIRFLGALEAGQARSAKTGKLLKPASARTRDRYAGDCKSFAAWMARNQRFGPRAHNPFDVVGPAFREGDETMERMALTLDELKRLVDSAAAADGNARDNANRSVLYWVAGLTGLRLNECRHLTWNKIVFGGKASYISISGKQVQVAKNRKTAEIPLVPWVADKLREEQLAQAKHTRKAVGGRDLVFPSIPKDSHAMPRRIRADAARANLPLEDDEGRVLDFHALRGSCATILLGLSVDPHIVQQIMRHSTLDLTMRHYAKVRRSDLHSAVQDIPDPCSPSAVQRLQSDDTVLRGRDEVGG